MQFDELLGTQLTVTAADVIIDLRHRVLRAGLPCESAIFPGDDAPDTIHFAAFSDQRIICCASFYLNTHRSEPAWQLRGMATDENHRGKGVGRALLSFAQASILNQSPIRLFWCNARVPAVPFYLSQGWRIDSEIFDIPTAGPHRVMVKNCSP
jgi:predicted GNAT family N-acyltransferase